MEKDGKFSIKKLIEVVKLVGVVLFFWFAVLGCSLSFSVKDGEAKIDIESPILEKAAQPIVDK